MGPKFWDLRAELGLIWDHFRALIPIGTKSQIWDLIASTAFSPKKLVEILFGKNFTQMCLKWCLKYKTWHLLSASVFTSAHAHSMWIFNMHICICLCYFPTQKQSFHFFVDYSPRLVWMNILDFRKMNILFEWIFCIFIKWIIFWTNILVEWIFGILKNEYFFFNEYSGF